MKDITIAIPAHNEEANISLLLQDILSQKNIRKLVKEIVVVSDGSTDTTTSEVSKVKSSLVKLVVQRKRRGLAKTLNHIFSIAKTDILVVLNADAHIQSKDFIEKLTLPIKKGRADLVSVKLTEVPAVNEFEKILYTGLTMKSSMVQSWRRGNNALTCYGVARGFSRKLYSSLHIPQSIGDDAYTYFYAITNGFSYSFVKNAEIFYRPSTNYKEHRKQTLRFFTSQSIMKKTFGREIVEPNYKIPVRLIIKELFSSIMRSPMYTILYLGTVLMSKIISLFTRTDNVDYWEVSESSKKLRINV